MTAIAFSSDSSTVVEGNQEGIIRSFSLDSGDQLNEVVLNGSAIKDIKLNPSGSIYAVCTSSEIILLNSSNLAILERAEFPDGECSDIEWFPNGTAFSTVGRQSSLSQYVVFNTNLDIQQRLNVDLQEGSEVYESVISPNGRYIVVAGVDRSNTTSSNVLVYELATGQFIG